MGSSTAGKRNLVRGEGRSPRSMFLVLTFALGLLSVNVANADI